MTLAASIELPLRRIDLLGRGRCVAAEVDRPLLVWLPIRKLVLDPVYQRPILKRGWKQIEAIARDFDWSRFGPVLVSTRPDGTYAVVDGQHRAHAALLAGFDEVPAMVAEMTREAEAAAFGAVNSQVTAITPFQLLKAAIAAGDEVATEAFEVVRAAGCKLMTYNKSSVQRKPGEIFAITTVLRLVERGQAKVVRRGLSSIRQSRNSEAIDAYALAMLQPWFDAVSENPAIGSSQLCAFWDAMDIRAFWRRVQACKDNEPGTTRARLARRELHLMLVERV